MRSFYIECLRQKGEDTNHCKNRPIISRPRFLFVLSLFDGKGEDTNHCTNRPIISRRRFGELDYAQTWDSLDYLRGQEDSKEKHSLTESCRSINTFKRPII